MSSLFSFLRVIVAKNKPDKKKKGPVEVPVAVTVTVSK